MGCKKKKENRKRKKLVVVGDRRGARKKKKNRKRKVIIKKEKKSFVGKNCYYGAAVGKTLSGIDLPSVQIINVGANETQILNLGSEKRRGKKVLVLLCGDFVVIDSKISIRILLSHHNS